MGWLFALALGLQRKSERAIFISLGPIALGHALSLTLVAGAVLLLGALLPTAALEVAAAAPLLAFGAWKLRNYYRHPRWVGMRVTLRDLVLWSFLMATGHGAGLMVAPVMADVAGGVHAMGRTAGGAALTLGLSVLVHTGAMLVVMTLVAWIVYRKLGLAVLRRSWVNFDLIWAGALLLVGAIALAHGAMGLRAGH